MNSNRTAIDIALIPPPAITDISIKINKKLIAFSKNRTVVLEKNSCIPHITLAMGTICNQDTEKFFEELKIISRKYLPFSAKYKGLAAVKTSENQVVSGIDIIRCEELQNLQEEIKGLLIRYNSGDVAGNMVYPDNKEITEFTLEYSSGYLEKSTGDSFSPHITLGYGDVYDISVSPLPPSFDINEIAICHLGNHCTCKEILRRYSV